MFQISVKKKNAYREEKGQKNKQYILRQSGHPNFPYWLENEDGEGMQISTINLFDLLDKYFEKNF